MTLDKIIYSVLNPKNFKIKTFEPFSNLSLKFVKDFSNELRKNKNFRKYPNLIYLLFWCNNQIKFKEKKQEEFLRLGRGLTFHVCPANVPTNFIYSFFFGLLSGNSNVVKIPSKPFDEKKIILDTISKLFKKKEYKVYKESNKFIEYFNNNEITKYISSICDARVIWGCDNTINSVRKNWIPERSIDLTFADRYSFSLINVDKLKKEKKFNLIVKNFFYDSYIMDQLACNSPHFVFWLGKKNNDLQDRFWKTLNNIVEKKYSFDEMHILNKYTSLMSHFIKNDVFKKVDLLKNNVFVLTPNDNLNNIENMRGVNGTFFQKNIKKLSYLKKFITKKCQTISYYGTSKNQLKNFLSRNNILGVDRFVPIGSSLEINLKWDGYDVIKSLSRVVDYK